MVQSTLAGYDYLDFTQELINTNQQHPHGIRRETHTTYVDRFAYEQVESMSKLYDEQFLTGWSRSYYVPEKHMEAIMQFNSPNIPVDAISFDIYQESIDAAQNRMRSLPRVRAFDVTSELDKVSYKSSSAAGYDYVGEKGEPSGFNHKRAISRARATLWSVIKDTGEGIEHVIQTAVPDVGYTRTQLADLTEKTKVRQVWGRAFHYILLEGVVAHPFIKAVLEHDTFIHAGSDPTVSVPTLLSDIKRQCKWLYSLDWKQFDASVSRFEINAAFDIIKSHVIFPNFDTEQCFELTRQLFIHKKVAAPDGYIYQVHKGIPSGSYYTSIVGSIVNYLRIDYLWRKIAGHPPKQLFTLGDDSLSGDDQLVTPRTFAEEANSIGWYFNPDKTEYSTVPEEVTFLGRTSQGGLNKRDLVKCLRLMVYPEHPVESGRISAYRAQSIAEDAGGLSDILNTVADKLRRTYGIASLDEVPSHFRRYVFQI